MELNSPLRHLAAAGIMGAFFLVNPLALGCGDESVETYGFGADEMAAVVVGGWTGSVSYDDGARDFTLVLEALPAEDQQTGSLRQHLCGNRTLIASVDACIATSQFDVVGQLSVEGEEPRQVEGSLVAYGAELSTGEFTLYGHGERWDVQMIEGELAGGGEARDQDKSELLGEFTLSRASESTH